MRDAKLECPLKVFALGPLAYSPLTQTHFSKKNQNKMLNLLKTNFIPNICQSLKISPVVPVF